jgi:predicted nucleic acid-binding Zn ribbon protein
MLPIQRFSGTVLAEVVRRQPSSPARTDFAWQVAVGPALARSTTVSLDDGVLTVRATDARWGSEVARARDVVLARLQNLLGADAVRSIRVERPSSRQKTSKVERAEDLLTDPADGGIPRRRQD